MKKYDIAVIPGDGTGPEVVAEARKVLDAVGGLEGFSCAYQVYDFGGERYLKTGEILPESAIDELRGFKNILLGAIGHPDVKPGILEKGILLKLRFALDQYINLRPVKLYAGVETPLKDKGPEDIDFVVVRENSEGGMTVFPRRKRTCVERKKRFMRPILSIRKPIANCMRYTSSSVMRLDCLTIHLAWPM